MWHSQLTGEDENEDWIQVCSSFGFFKWIKAADGLRWRYIYSYISWADNVEGSCRIEERQKWENENVDRFECENLQ